MAKRVVWSEDSLRDRKRIANYWQWRLGNKKYASKLDKKFRDIARVIRLQPYGGSRVKGRGTRYYVVGPYQVFYRMKDDVVEIVRVWDSRRNPDDVKF